MSELHSAFQAPMLVLSTYSREFAVRSLRAGASGYVHKGSSRQELVRAMRRIMGGGRYLSDTMAEKSQWEPRRRLPRTGCQTVNTRFCEVSPRERSRRNSHGSCP